ncbi:MAG: Crp/Fnr family transcriptional regulator, partial [Bdellovibrio sp.]
SDIPLEVQREFDSAAQRIEFRRGDVVYREGDLPRGLYFVEEGLIGLMLLGATSGKEHLVRFFRRGQLFGHRALFSNEGYHGTATALEPTTLRMIDRTTLYRVLERFPQLYKEITVVLAKELRRCEVQHVMILENQILSRTAQALVYLKDLHPEHKWTRQEIANFSASTVSTIIKALAELESMGLIRQEGRSIEILNREELIALQDREGQ